eukprot:9137183-Lingulodinium_polyedra.AAC.1
MRPRPSPTTTAISGSRARSTRGAVFAVSPSAPRFSVWPTSHCCDPARRRRFRFPRVEAGFARAPFTAQRRVRGAVAFLRGRRPAFPQRRGPYIHAY